MSITTFFQEETEMMKKLSRIALLAAASAFMLAVLPACGDDDSGEETPPPVTDTDDKEQNENGGQGGTTATFTFLSGDYTNSSTAVAEEGFFNGTKTGTLAVTVSAVELQLYKTEGGWTAIDASASSTKAAGGANMGGAGGPASVQAQLTTKSDAVANQSNEVFGENGYEMGRIKLVVTTSESAVVLKKISGYFGSGKSFAKGYVKVDGNEYKEITETTALGTKGFSVDGFEVNQTIPANNTKDVYILLGKVATSAPSAGGTIDVAKLVYEFAAAEN